MANIKISELEELTTVEDSDVLPIVDISSGETKKVKSNKFNQDYFNGNKPMGSIVVDDIRSKNLVNRIIYGYELGNLGEINVNQNWFITDYISVVPGETYTQSGFSSNYAEFTNSNKEYVSDSNDKTFQVPNSACYVRLNGSIATSSNMQLELGSTATNYSEYKGIGYTSGSNENGSWVKYDDGRMECWGVKSYSNVAITNLDIRDYYAQLPAQPFPQAFISSPICVMSIDNVQPVYALQLKSTGNGATETHTPMTLAFCAASITATRIEVQYHAIGRGK